MNVNKENSLYSVCAVCGAEAPNGQKLKACGGCKQVRYCSKKCQKDHWKEHKIACGHVHRGDFIKNVPVALSDEATPEEKLADMKAQYEDLDMEALKAKADAGDVEAQQFYGVALGNSTQDYSEGGEAMKYLHMAAKHDHPLAVHAIGNAYRYLDWRKCFKYFERAFALGDAQSAYDLFLIYYREECDIITQSKSLKLAKKWFIAAADAGHPLAQGDLGAAYAEGDKKLNIPRNFKKGINYLSRAASQGHVSAHFTLGKLYRPSLAGTEDMYPDYKGKNGVKSLKHFKFVATNPEKINNSEYRVTQSYYNMGRLYGGEQVPGCNNVPQTIANEVKSLACLKKAAKITSDGCINFNAVYFLAKAYQSGIGTPVDRHRAGELFWQCVEASHNINPNAPGRYSEFYPNGPMMRAVINLCMLVKFNHYELPMLGKLWYSMNLPADAIALDPNWQEHHARMDIQDAEIARKWAKYNEQTKAKAVDLIE